MPLFGRLKEPTELWAGLYEPLILKGTEPQPLEGTFIALASESELYAVFTCVWVEGGDVQVQLHHSKADRRGILYKTQNIGTSSQLVRLESGVELYAYGKGTVKQATLIVLPLGPRART